MCCGLRCRSIWWCFLFFLSGFALMGVGIWTPVDDRVFDAVTAFRPGLIEDPIAWRGWVGGLLALGAWSIIVGILGMAGASCDDDKQRNSLIAFAVLGSLGTIGCLALGGLSTAAYVTDDESSYYQTLNEALDENYIDQFEQNDFILAWNRYQIEFECCGVEDFKSYQWSAFYNTTGTSIKVPWSCCELQSGYDFYYPEQGDVDDPIQCELEANFAVPLPTFPDALNEIGCGPEMWSRFRQWQTAVMGIAWAASGIQIVALILTGCLRDD